MLNQREYTVNQSGLGVMYRQRNGQWQVAIDSRTTDWEDEYDDDGNPMWLDCESPIAAEFPNELATAQAALVAAELQLESIERQHKADLEDLRAVLQNVSADAQRESELVNSLLRLLSLLKEKV